MDYKRTVILGREFHKGIVVDDYGSDGVKLTITSEFSREDIRLSADALCDLIIALGENVTLRNTIPCDTPPSHHRKM